MKINSFIVRFMDPGTYLSLSMPDMSGNEGHNNRKTQSWNIRYSNKVNLLKFPTGRHP